MATISPFFRFVTSVGDPEGTRTVTSIVALLVAIGVALLLVARWLFRTTRPDPELLAPLELMGERAWRRGDPVWQRRRLDEVRPKGARPLTPSAAPPELDESFDAGPSASGFDDLRAERLVLRIDGPDGPRADVAGAATRPRSTGDTPVEAARPELEHDLSDDFDAEALSKAGDDLDRELAGQGQLDLFDDGRSDGRSGGEPASGTP